MKTLKHLATTWREWLARVLSTSALFLTATLVVVHGATHPHQLPLPGAARMASAPGMSPSESSTSTVRVRRAIPSWELANIQNSRVDTWVARFTTSLRGEFAAALQRKTRFAGPIQSDLAAREMPTELVYLAMIESGFQPTARSHAGAVGLWQFMSATARRFGLRVGGGVDQRDDPAKETNAALTYLERLHQRFGSWYLAAAAYNAGPGTVAGALETVLGRATGSDSDFYRIAHALPAETRNYVPKLIAAARIGKDPASYGFGG